MESLQAALGKGFGLAARIGIKVFRTAVFNALFLLSEEDLELAIEEDVDLLGLFLIYAPQHVQMARQFAGRVGKGFERKITKENSLRWVKEECDRKGTRHYDVIVNLPEGADPPAEGRYLPKGYDKERVKWFWGNVQRLLNYVIYGKISKSTKQWGVEHLRWLAQQEKGKNDISGLLNKGHEEADARAKKKVQEA